MAKKPQPLTLSDLNVALTSAKLGGVNPAIAEQLKAAMPEATPSITAATEAATPKVQPPAVAAEPSASLNIKAMNRLSDNIITLASVIEKNTKAIQKRIDPKPNNSPVNKLATTPNSDPNDITENQVEDQKVKDHQTALLERIEENTRPQKEKAAEPKEKTQIGFLGTLIAAALGTLAGVITAYAKLIGKGLVGLYKGIKSIGETLIKLIPDSIKALGPKIVDSFKTNVDKLIINVEHAFGTMIELFKNRFPKAFTFVQDSIDAIKALGPKIVDSFKTNGELLITNVQRAFGTMTDLFKNRFPKVFAFIQESVESFSSFFKSTFESFRSGKIFTDIKIALTNFFEPIVDAFKVISTESSTVGGIVSKVVEVVESVVKFFGKIGSWLGSFAKVFKAFFVIGEKLALPVTIIMGMFEGISTAIDEFKKSGDIISTLGAFIKGALHSAIGSVLDLFKDIFSWILGKLGFDKLSKILDSFSFNTVIDKVVDIMDGFWHAVFSPIETIKKIFTGITDWMSQLEIPAFSIFGHKFGPWKPLSGLTGENTEEAPVTAAKAPATNIQQKQETESHVEKNPDGSMKYMINGKEVDQKTYMDNYNKNQAEMGDGLQAQAVTPATVAPSKKSTYADQMYGKSAQVAAGDKTQPQAKQSTIVSAPTQINNQTQNAIIKQPPRNQENSLMGYLKSRFV